jgi:hypothetical protein
MPRASKKRKPIAAAVTPDRDGDVLMVTTSVAPESSSTPATETTPTDEADKAPLSTRPSMGSVLRVAGSLTAVGSLVALALLALGAWCIVLVPVHAVRDDKLQPPNAESLFRASRCLIQANAARVVGNGQSIVHDDLKHCLEDLDKHAKGVSVAAYASHLDAAWVGFNTNNAVAVAAALHALVDDHIAKVREEVGDSLRVVWAPVIRTLAALARRSYRVAVARSTAAPKRRSASQFVTEFNTSATYLRYLGGRATSSSLYNLQSRAIDAIRRDSATLNGQLLRPDANRPVSDVDVMRDEALALLNALRLVIDGAVSDNTDAHDTYVIATALTSVLLGAATIVCIGGITFIVVLTRRYTAVESYRQSIRSDFEVDEDSAAAVPKAEVLRAFSLACAKFSVMDTTPDEAVDQDTSQIVLHLQRAKPTLAAIRPFVPQVAYARRQNFDAFGRILPRIDMSAGLEVDQACTVVVVGMRDYNHRAADVRSLPLFVRDVQLAAAANNGIVAQIEASHVLVAFRSRDDELEQSATPGARPPGALQAVHMAFAVLAAGARLQQTYRGHCVSVAIAQGCTLLGPITTESTRVFGVVSHVVTTAITLETMTRDLGACIVCDQATAHSIDERILTRPVSLCPSRRTTVYECILPFTAVEDSPSPAETAMRDRVARWVQTFEKYEDAVTGLVPDRLEEAYADLLAYRQFVTASLDSPNDAEDAVFMRVREDLRRVMSELGVAV